MLKEVFYHDKVLSSTSGGISPKGESFCFQCFLKFINLSKDIKVHLESSKKVLLPLYIAEFQDGMDNIYWKWV